MGADVGETWRKEDVLSTTILILLGVAVSLIAWGAHTCAILVRRARGIVASNWTATDYAVLLGATAVGGALAFAFFLLVLGVPADALVGRLGLGCLTAFMILCLLRGRGWRPGSLTYRPFTITYWPSWIRVERNMAVGRLCKVQFKLMEATFDLKTIRIRQDNKSSQPLSHDSADAHQFAENNTILLPLRHNDERALTATGRLRHPGPHPVQLLCIAEAFVPTRIERATTIESLVEKGELLELRPTTPGRHMIRISLLVSDMKLAAGVTIFASVSS